MPTDETISDEVFMRAAKALHHIDGEIEIEPEGVVSRNDEGDDGAYVSAWIWVSNEDAKANGGE